MISTFRTTADSIANITKICKQVPFAIVVDDSGDLSNNTYVSQSLSSINNILVITNVSNVGLAESLNTAIEKAHTFHYKWVIVFDDDTKVVDDAISNAATVISKSKDTTEAKQNNIYALSRSQHVDTNVSINSLVKRKVVITSGSLFSIKLFHKLQGFENRMFIDLLDFDFCLRAQYQDAKVYSLNRADLKHTVGHPKHINLLFVKVLISNHAPFRYYYHYRNSVLFSRRHLMKNPKFVIKLNLGLTIKFIKMVLFEHQKFDKFKCTFYGLFHGVIDKYGRFQSH